MKYSSLRLKVPATIATQCEVLPCRLESKTVVRQTGERKLVSCIPHYSINVRYAYSVAGGRAPVAKDVK